jgi:hypothetical protein
VPDPFATAAEMAQFSNMTVPEDLARMQMLLDAASAEIRGQTGQVLSTVAADVVTLGPTSVRTLYLPQRPVTAIITVVVKGVTLASTDYSFSSYGHLVHGGTPADYSTKTWPDGATVTYDHGYAEFSTEYQRIKTICIEVALRAFTMNERSASETLGMTVLESGGYSPEIFLTAGERMSLMNFDPIGVG